MLFFSRKSSSLHWKYLNNCIIYSKYRSSGPISYGFASLENSTMLDTETICSVDNSDDSGPPSLQNELDNLPSTLDQATSPQSDESPIVPNPPGKLNKNTIINTHFIYHTIQY